MNKLEHLEEFQRALQHYQISKTGQELLGEISLVLLVAPTSSGRNTIIRELVKSGHYHYMVSDTTRKPRINDGVQEQNGVEYWFRPENEVLSDIKAGKFLEAAVIHQQQVSGISLREIEITKQKHQIAVTDVEIAGVHNIMSAKPDTIAIFVVPPSFSEWQRRITGRGHMDPAELKRRLKSAVDEFKHAMDQPYYHFVVNDNLADAVAEIDELVKNAQSHKPDNSLARAAVESIYSETIAHLKNI